MSARAGIVVTGTEVLTGRVVDRNGPWVSERLRDLGVEHTHTVVVGDRPEDMARALSFFADLDVVVTSGGLGPTEDDRTAEVVGTWQGREMVLDDAMEGKIWSILAPMRERWPHLDEAAVRASNRKQAVVPRGATVLDPVGTAPGLVSPPLEPGSGPTVVVLPGPPRELQPMWETAAASEAFKAAIAGATEYRQSMLRLFGIPESELAATMRAAREEGIDLDDLEITTCLRRGEIEIVTRWEPRSDPVYRAWEDTIRARHADTLFSDDGRSVDTQVADLLRASGRRIATAESCTGGLLAARLTEAEGASDFFAGSLVVYADEAKVGLAGVPAEFIQRHGAVSGDVAEALADGAMRAVGADVGVGITGIAGPGGGSEDKPVGTVWFSVTDAEGARLTRRVHLPGGRADVRDRSTTVALHLVRRLLRGEGTGAEMAAAVDSRGSSGPATTGGGPVGDEG